VSAAEVIKQRVPLTIHKAAVVSATVFNLNCATTEEVSINFHLLPYLTNMCLFGHYYVRIGVGLIDSLVWSLERAVLTPARDLESGGRGTVSGWYRAV